MSESGTESTLITWSVPECPFTIECSARALDDIRLAVTDAFFSLPRGGAEIGGILLGDFDGSRVSVLEYAPLDCEHAFGPSFQISLNDEARLKDLLAIAPQEFPGLRTVGWYHSHTRSGIFLSEADLEIHRLYFAEPWQIALVMKPHTFEPTRMGFFFREPDGSFHSHESYKEMLLEPQPMKPVPAAIPPRIHTPRPDGAERERPRRPFSQVEIETTAEPVTAAAAAPAPAPVVAPVVAPAPPIRVMAPTPVAAPPPAEPEKTPEAPAPNPPVPQFLSQQPPPRRRWGMIAVLTLLILGAAGAAVFTREAWVPGMLAAIRPGTPAPVPPPSMGLHTNDRDGQMEVTWDRFALPIREASGGTLEVADGSTPLQTIALDKAHLQAGSFSYERQSEKVDITLRVYRQDGQQFHEVTAFLGRLPTRKVQEQEAVAAKKERDELAAQAAKMKTDLNWQVVKTKKLEKDLQDLRKRMTNQVGEGKQ